MNVYVNGLEWQKANFPESEEEQFRLTSLELHESESTIKVSGSSLAIINDPYMSLRNRFVFNMPDWMITMMIAMTVFTLLIALCHQYTIASSYNQQHQ